MPKLKPHKGLLKRVKVTATGKIVRHQASRGHLMSTKSSRRRRRLSRVVVAKRVDLNKVRRLLALA